MSIGRPRQAARAFVERHVRGLALAATIAGLTAIVLARSDDPAMATAVGAGELLARSLLAYWAT